MKYAKCRRCGFEITDMSIFGWYAPKLSYVDTGCHGATCSGKWGVKPGLSDTEKDLRNPENLHFPETKEDHIRKILDRIDESR